MSKIQKKQHKTRVRPAGGTSLARGPRPGRGQNLKILNPARQFPKPAGRARELGPTHARVYKSVVL